jgi:hypothetical protein
VRTASEAELVQAFAHRYLPILDNLSSVSESLSNSLARAVTGDGFTKRRLYTDDGDVIYEFRRVVIVTGINVVATRPDLLDRALLISPDAVLPQERLDEGTLADRFRVKRAEIFGGLLDLLAGAIREMPHVSLPTLPRMADFAKWGAAVMRAQGRDGSTFLEHYAVNSKRQSDQAIEGSTTAVLLLEFLSLHRKGWTGTVYELLCELRSLADGRSVGRRDLVTSPQALGRKLREIRPSLTASGWDVEFGASHHPREVRITPRGKV